jgi:hypothetical protein
LFLNLSHSPFVLLGVTVGIGALGSAAGCIQQVAHCNALKVCCDLSTFPAAKESDCNNAVQTNIDATCANALNGYAALGVCGSSGAGGAGTGTTSAAGGYGSCYRVVGDSSLMECYYYPTSAVPCAEVRQIAGHCPFGNCCIDGGTTTSKGTAHCYSRDSAGLYKSMCSPPDTWTMAPP